MRSQQRELSLPKILDIDSNESMQKLENSFAFFLSNTVRKMTLRQKYKESLLCEY